MPPWSKKEDTKTRIDVKEKCNPVCFENHLGVNSFLWDHQIELRQFLKSGPHSKGNKIKGFLTVTMPREYSLAVEMEINRSTAWELPEADFQGRG